MAGAAIYEHFAEDAVQHWVARAAALSGQPLTQNKSIAEYMKNDFNNVTNALGGLGVAGAFLAEASLVGAAARAIDGRGKIRIPILY